MRPLTWYEVGNNLSMRIVRAAQEVYNFLGPGCPENHYRRAVVHALEQQDLDVQHAFPVDVWQSGELAELYFLDLFVEMQAVVNVYVQPRAFTQDDREVMADQALAAGAPVGILLNFGRRRFEYERVFP